MERCLRTQLAHAALPLLLAACSAKPSVDSRVVIRLPEGDTSVQSKIATLSTFPADRRLCFAVNVMGSGIVSASPGKCGVPLGVSDGFQGLGGQLSVLVPQGNARRFELLAFLADASSRACPSLADGLSSANLGRVYRVGLTENIDIQAPEVTVTINAAFPGLSQSILVQDKMPRDCVPRDPPRNPAAISNATATLTGPGIRLRARIGNGKIQGELTGNGIRVRGGLRTDSPEGKW